jgi:hypothetical protein
VTDPRIYLARCRVCREVIGLVIASEPRPEDMPYCSTKCLAKGIKEGGWK